MKNLTRIIILLALFLVNDSAVWAATTVTQNSLPVTTLILIIAGMFAAALCIYLIYESHSKKEITKNLQENLSAPTKTKDIHWQANNEKIYRTLFEQVKSGIFMANENGILIYANNTFAQLLGYQTSQDVIGMSLKEQWKESQTSLFDLFKNINEVNEHAFKLLTKEGKKITLSFSGNKIWDENGKVTGILGVIHDITNKSHMEQLIVTEKYKLETLFKFFDTIDQLRDLKELYNYVVREISDIMDIKRCSIMIFDKNQEYMTIEASHGVPNEILSPARIYRKEDCVAGIVAEKKQPLLIKNIDYDPAFDTYRKPYYQARSFIVVPLLLGDTCTGVISITEKKSEIMEGRSFEDIDLKIMKLIAHKVAAVIDNICVLTELNLLTTTDPMTNVYNYRKFLNGLEHEIQRFNREKMNLYVFMIDVDDFKSYNDTFGHPEGDELLRGIGEILKKNLRATDLVCRYAGDEFCIVVSELDQDDVQTVAKKIIAAIEEFPFKRKVTVSIGIAMFEGGSSKKDFIKKADIALYQAKRNGKNQVVIG